MNGFWMLSAIWWMQISFVFTSPVYIFQHGNMLSTSTIRWKIEVLRVSNWDKQFGLNIRKLVETHRSLVRSWLLILGMTLKAHFDSLYWEYSSCLQMHWEETLDPVVRGRFCWGYESETGRHLCKWLEWKKKENLAWMLCIPKSNFSISINRNFWFLSSFSPGKKFPHFF